MALSLVVASVAAAAAPAHASLQYIYSNSVGMYSFGTRMAYGSTATYFDPDWSAVPNDDATFVQANVTKDQWNDLSMQNHCVELWVDQKQLVTHRPPDVFINCKASQTMVSPNLLQQWPAGGGNYAGYVAWAGGYATTPNPRAAVNVCYVAIDGPNRMKRERGWGLNNCIGDEDVYALRPPQSGGSQIYNGKPYLWTANALTEMNNNDEPQHIRADGIGTLNQDQALHKGDLLMSTDGHYAAVMQFDGNFVIRDNWTGGTPWAASWCGLSPWAGSRVVMQSDGNVVIYSPTNVPLWASANMNTCHHGGFVPAPAGTHLEMQTDGNLVAYSNYGVTWARL